MPRDRTDYLRVPYVTKIRINGLKKKEVLSGARCIKLSSADMDKDNTIENPLAIIPQETSLDVDGHTLNVDLEPATFAVYILKY